MPGGVFTYSIIAKGLTYSAACGNCRQAHHKFITLNILLQSTLLLELWLMCIHNASALIKSNAPYTHHFPGMWCTHFHINNQFFPHNVKKQQELFLVTLCYVFVSRLLFLFEKDDIIIDWKVIIALGGGGVKAGRLHITSKRFWLLTKRSWFVLWWCKFKYVSKSFLLPIFICL